MIEQAYCCGQNDYAVALSLMLKTNANLVTGCGCGCGGEALSGPVLVQYGCDCGGGSTYDPGIGGWTNITSLDTNFYIDLSSINAALGTSYQAVKWRIEKEYIESGNTYQTIHVVGMVVYANNEDPTIFPDGKNSCFTVVAIPLSTTPIQPYLLRLRLLEM